MPESSRMETQVWGAGSFRLIVLHGGHNCCACFVTGVKSLHVECVDLWTEQAVSPCLSLLFSRLAAHCLLEQPGMFQQTIDVVWKQHQRHSVLKSAVFCCRFQSGLPGIWANVHKDQGQNPCDHLQIFALRANDQSFLFWS